MKRIGGHELRRLYDGIREKSVRWEDLQTCAVPWEDEEFEAWCRGEVFESATIGDDYL